ncbi:hypothetical protein BH769_gp35 [Gordonia phage BritBrat]|uniref:Uncharacterized protein n=1 Tax=Gordonia phage BritBrat TaxID=1838064 RepID=A0A166XZJ8_9CAUD|nr:hypothetical protein BH769_gp35 [Gordonia phage BritBrat]ANA85243.1 hypothetical protein PBI_BRITBRAT_35 [Gordonia phage BritBrat]
MPEFKVGDRVRALREFDRPAGHVIAKDGDRVHVRFSYSGVPGMGVSFAILPSEDLEHID